MKNLNAADLDRFAKLGVIANFTPHWHAGETAFSAAWLGEERSKKQFRGKDADYLVFDQDLLTAEVEWKPYSAGEQNVLDIAGPDDIRIKRDLLADQYKAVLPLVDYYQFIDKYFTPAYMSDILAAREQKS